MPRYDKGLGQHHLIGGHLCRPILDFLDPAPGSAGEAAGEPAHPAEGTGPGAGLVIEIGPGGGVLTRELLEAGFRVVAWELDRAWAAELTRRLPAAELTVVLGDALDIDWGALPPGCQVAGNLPYQVATALIQRLLRHAERVPRAAFLVQKEVGERLVAGPGDPAYGALSVLVAARSRVRWLARVRRGSFHPPPKVEGAFIGFEPHPPPLPPAEMEAFEATVRLAFGQRRKTLRNALAAGWGKKGAAAVLAAAGIDGGLRAERLSLDDFLRLAAAQRGA